MPTVAVLRDNAPFLNVQIHECTHYSIRSDWTALPEAEATLRQSRVTELLLEITNWIARRADPLNRAVVGLHGLWHWPARLIWFVSGHTFRLDAPSYLRPQEFFEIPEVLARALVVACDHVLPPVATAPDASRPDVSTQKDQVPQRPLEAQSEAPGKSPPRAPEPPESVPDQIRRLLPRRKDHATFAEYFERRKSARYAEIEDVLGHKMSNEAIEAFVRRVNRTMEDLQEPTRYRCGAEYVFKELHPE
jgi:hypothetical protein